MNRKCPPLRISTIFCSLALALLAGCGSSWEELSETRGSDLIGDGISNEFTLGVNLPLTQLTGSFPSVSNLQSVSDSAHGAGWYSLQLNSTEFVTAACQGVGACRGWVQFVYQTDVVDATISTWFWLRSYGASCPLGGWLSDGAGNCSMESTPVHVTPEPITNLPNMQLTANVGAGASDFTSLWTGSALYSDSGIADNQINLASVWKSAEFNVFGFANGSLAKFNANATIKGRMDAASGTTTAPSCTQQTDFTAEENSLSPVAHSCCPNGGSAPAVTFLETNAANVLAQFCVSEHIGAALFPVLL